MRTGVGRGPWFNSGSNVMPLDYLVDVFGEADGLLIGEPETVTADNLAVLETSRANVEEDRRFDLQVSFDKDTFVDTIRIWHYSLSL